MKGSKCRYNEYHRKSFRCSKRINERHGTIMGETKDGKCYYVSWDDAKGRKMVSKGFIEIISEPLNLKQIVSPLTELNNHYNSTLKC